MEITKIKYNFKEVSIHSIDDKKDEVELLSKDEPLLSFRNAFDSFAIHLIRIAEQPSDSIMEIRGLTFSDAGDNGDGLIITGLRTLKTGFKLLLNSPITYSKLWTDAMFEDVNLIKEEARKYINGQRAYKQEELEFDFLDDKTIEKDKTQTEIKQILTNHIETVKKIRLNNK